MFVVVQGIVCIAPCIADGYQLDLLKPCSKWLLSLSAFVPDAASVVQECPGHALSCVLNSHMVDAVQVALQWAHSQPHSMQVWHLFATVALHYASRTHQAATYRAALLLCKRAQNMLSSSCQAQQQQTPGSVSGHAPQHGLLQQQQQQHMQVKLQCMMSECHVHGRKKNGDDEALAAAKAAVQAASGFRDSQLICIALQQLSR